MKTLPLRRALLCACLLALMLSTSARAEWITLQVPLTRATNTFSLWEVAPGAANPATPFPVTDTGIVKTSLSSITFIGGSFDALGNWVPDQNSYALVQAERAGTGDFWLRDLSNGAFAPRNQTALTSAPWMASASGNGLRLFAIESARATHGFSLQYDDGAFVSMSSSGPQVEYDLQGNVSDLGFFLAWVPARGPFSGAEWIIDHDANQRTGGTALTSNLVNAYWEPFTGETPTYTAVILVPTASPGDLFDVEIPGVSVAQAAAGWWEGTDPNGNPYAGIAVAGNVGQGYPFRLVRLADQHGSPQFRMGEGDLVIDSTGWLPTLPAAQWETRTFSLIDAVANEGPLTIRYTDGSSSPMVLDGGGGSTLEAWDDFGNIYTATLLRFDADIDINRTWWIEQLHGTEAANLGNGPVLMGGWAPSHLVPPNGSAYAWVPSVRQGRALMANQTTSWLTTETGATTFFSLESPVGGSPITWQAYLLTAIFETSSAPFTLSDPVAGDVSIQATANALNDLSVWFPDQPMVLKISATRWGKTLVIRTPLGDRPITRHQMQGDWSLDGAGHPWFNPYGYFDATAAAYEGLPWWLVDLGVPGHPATEVLSTDPSTPNDFIAATDNTNSDSDSLKDWEERLLGTNPYSEDTDGDGINDDLDEYPRARPATAPGSTLKVYTQLR